MDPSLCLGHGVVGRLIRYQSKGSEEFWRASAESRRVGEGKAEFMLIVPILAGTSYRLSDAI